MINKIRYLNPKFQDRLKAARNYKRQVKKIPRGKMGIFLALVHLDSWRARISAALLIAALIYGIYAPNFLTVKNVRVLGASDSARASVEQSIQAYLTKKALRPQRNLLLLSENGLAQFLEQKNFRIQKIAKIQKDFPHGLTIEIVERQNQFLLKAGESLYAVTGDGIVAKQLMAGDLSAPGSSYAALIPLNLKTTQAFYEQQRLNGAEYFENLNEIAGNSQRVLESSIAEINLNDLEQPNLEVRGTAGLILKLDINSDLGQIFSRLKLLLKDIGENKLKEVEYIDMRIKDRGYVCFKNSPCVRNAASEPKTGSLPDNF